MAQSVDSLIDLQAPLEPSKELGLAVQKAYLCLTLAKTCISYLGFGALQHEALCMWPAKMLRKLSRPLRISAGWQWLACFIRLIMFSVLLSPGIFLTSLFYCFSPRIHKNIWYNREARNLLDIYIPYRHHFETGRVPVLIYVTGGAYMIGYKAWGAVLARRMSKCGVITCCLDYRNFPQGTVDDMVLDVQHGIGWVLNRIEGYGGDRSEVYVMGQSCGGHLAALALIHKQRCRKPVASADMAQADGEISWHPSDLKGFIGFCSPYNIEEMQLHFQKRGLAPRLLQGIFCPKYPIGRDRPSYARVCPVSLLDSAFDRLCFPRSMLLHAESDASVPSSESDVMARCLRRHGVEVLHKVYQSATHTSKLIEDPFRGGNDEVVNDVLRFMNLQIPGNLRFWPLVPFPYTVTMLAQWICPF